MCGGYSIPFREKLTLEWEEYTIGFPPEQPEPDDWERKHRVPHIHTG